jgi:hypothetical protein
MVDYVIFIIVKNVKKKAEQKKHLPVNKHEDHINVKFEHHNKLIASCQWFTFAVFVFHRRASS